MTTKIKETKVTSEDAFTAAEDKRLKLNDAGKYPNYTTRTYEFQEKILLTGSIHLEADWDNLSDEKAVKLVKQYRKDNRVPWHEISDTRDVHVVDAYLEKYDSADTTLIISESLMDIKVDSYGSLDHVWDDTKGYQIKLKEQGFKDARKAIQKRLFRQGCMGTNIR